MDRLTGCGFVAIWNDVSRGTEEDFFAWHADEHMPERLAIPGFLRGMRWGNEGATPRYFTLYMLSGSEVARSADYTARLNDPTPWTQRVMNSFRDNARCVGEFTSSLGEGPGQGVMVLRLNGRLAPEVPDAIMKIDGVSGCHLGLSDTATSALATVERQGRIVTEPQGLLIVCLAPKALAAAVAKALSEILPQDTAEAMAVLTLQLDRRRSQ